MTDTFLTPDFNINNKQKSYMSDYNWLLILIKKNYENWIINSNCILKKLFVRTISKL